MKISDINTKTLTSLLSLTKKKETLLAKIEEVERQINDLASGEVDAARRVIRHRAIKKRRGGKALAGSARLRSPKGFMKEQILHLLTAAGEVGADVKEMATHLGKPVQHVQTWFSSAGKKLGTLEKIGTGRWRMLRGQPASEQPTSEQPSPEQQPQG
jgi:hypothetical protein